MFEERELQFLPRIPDLKMPPWQGEGSGHESKMRGDLRICNSQCDSRQRERVRQPHCFRIHHGEAKEQEAEDSHSEAHDAEAELKEGQEKQGGCRELDGRIAPGNGLMAVAAASAQQNPAQDGQIVTSADRRAAAGTARPRMDDRLMTRQAGDADVEEAAEGEAEEDDKDGKERDQVCAPLPL